MIGAKWYAFRIWLIVTSAHVLMFCRNARVVSLGIVGVAIWVVGVRVVVVDGGGAVLIGLVGSVVTGSDMGCSRGVDGIDVWAEVGVIAVVVIVVVVGGAVGGIVNVISVKSVVVGAGGSTDADEDVGDSGDSVRFGSSCVLVLFTDKVFGGVVIRIVEACELSVWFGASCVSVLLTDKVSGGVVIRIVEACELPALVFAGAGVDVRDVGEPVWFESSPASVFAGIGIDIDGDVDVVIGDVTCTLLVGCIFGGGSNELGDSSTRVMCGEVYCELPASVLVFVAGC